VQLFNHFYHFILIDLKADVEDDGFQDREGLGGEIKASNSDP
jgi:hypothetical protein